jgi:hypothetical protein
MSPAKSSATTLLRGEGASDLCGFLAGLAEAG